VSKQSTDIEQAKHMIAVAAEDAVKTIANAAATAAKVNSAKDGNDHDLIIEIRTVQTTMLSEIREIKDGTAKRISDLENSKLNITDSYAQLYQPTVDRRLASMTTDIETLKDNKTRITLMLTLGISLLVILFGLLSFHIWGVRL